MRILHAITRMVHGGAQINTLMCAVEQARRGHEVTLLTGVETGPEGSLLEEAERAPIRLVKMPALVRNVHPGKDLLAFGQMVRLIGKNYDVVHTHTSKAGLLGRWAARLNRVPAIVHTPHGHIFHGYFPSRKERLFVMLERLSTRACHRQVMLTQGDLQDHLDEEIGPREHFLVVPSGVDLSRFQPTEPPGKQIVGTVLRLVEVKGILDLLDCFPKVLARCPQAQLHVAGHGPLREQIDVKIRDLQITRHVTMLGHVDPVGPFLQKLDLFALPSHNEGMGRAVVEAMACGLPIVATRIGGLPDLVEEGQNGRLVPPRSPDQLADALADLLENPQRCRDMGRASQQKAEQFSAQVMYDRLEALYQQLLN